jgi:mRNA interferase MazF
MTSRAGGPLRRPGVSKSRLPNDSVVNVSQLMTLDKSVLTEKVSRLPAESLREVEAGIKLVLALQ